MSKKNPPTKDEVVSILNRLISGELTRQSASQYATDYLIAEECYSDDRALWNALEVLGAADLIGIDRPFLYSLEDFQASLDELTAPH